jgi:protein-tyrosine phosphatase
VGGDAGSAQPRRRIPFEGAVNFRDLGGYPAADGRRVRWGWIYRSDCLATLSDRDHERLLTLGLRTLVDLRRAEERARFPNRLPEGLDLETVEIGFVPAGVAEMLRLVAEGGLDAATLHRHVIDQYRRFPVDHLAEYRRMLQVIARPGTLPLLIHCASGKDRTGFAAAVVLMTLGVPREAILEDYLLSKDSPRDVSHLFGRATPKAVRELLASVQSSYLEAAFAEIDRAWGSQERFLAAGLGIDEGWRTRLVELLTEPA